ncbi:NAD kinase [Cellulomonas dongxiuzhuiae]|uniref:NAD kinase n=1 Tax=Cellulomonas dongxiuzhuiae TaxID=2819979 RepID=A0ABX8GMT9_9CELL|nr:NAD kinase [Cellulomonas dongxiuzhuiae]MBO3087389.1 NAD kinase [Cellulomonas dongxiuzhuiae]MBO3093214.1 NAD kinase [Cellulomonas dongxiuzhuiae]QWC17504.1 NAD kinase [Cellulomonas dongxiuzhuiae]
MTRRALVVRHSGRPEAVAATDAVLRALSAAGVETVTASQDTRPDELPPFELAVVLGGDGTILRAAELTRGTDVPLLGVNLGHVGFLAEIEPADVATAVRRLTDGDYDVEERSTLEVRVIDAAGTVQDCWALNEAALEKTDPARMIEVVIEVDGRPLSSFGCDGLVAASATGSTAHAFSAGGPVVWPDVRGMVLVPLAAHTLFARPLVMGPSSVLAVEILERSPSTAVVTCDGRRQLPVARGTRIEVRVSDVPVRFARLNPAPFTTRLVQKFDLPVVGWRGAHQDDEEGAG